jgi:hypothetical protein
MVLRVSNLSEIECLDRPSALGTGKCETIQDAYLEYVSR